jgi:adenylate kinase family enzyme
MGSRCPVTWGLFLGTAAYVVNMKRKQLQSSSSETTTTSSSSSPVVCDVVFVLGAPGTGKGTQCQLLQRRLIDKNADGLWTHLSAGDLLRDERKKSGSELSDLINSKIAAGELVPSSITVKLLEIAITKINKETKCTKFLIDGFPRGHENMQAWETTMKYHTIKFVLNFECPEEVLYVYIYIYIYIPLYSLSWVICFVITYLVADFKA